MLNAHNRALSTSVHFKVSFVGFSTLSVSEMWERNLTIELSVKIDLTVRNKIHLKPNGNFKEKAASHEGNTPEVFTYVPIILENKNFSWVKFLRTFIVETTLSF